MKAFQTKQDALIGAIKDLITSETPTEQVNKLEGIISQVGELGNEHQKTEDELIKVKDLYIDSVKNTGSKEPPKDDGGTPPQPRTLEQIASDVLAQNKS